jgi:hypothetical protein
MGENRFFSSLWPTPYTTINVFLRGFRAFAVDVGSLCRQPSAIATGNPGKVLFFPGF